MMKRDLVLSSVLSSLLASLAFLFTFRRARAIVAVLPPLALGTLWTTGLAAFWPGGLSAIATAFAAVVVGVGVDTGVHVYAALLDARQRGLAPHDAAREARRVTWKPTMAAALVAGLAFASLALTDLAAVAQLGILCGAGEVLTAIAILLVTPEIGAWLERKSLHRAHGPPAWTRVVAGLTATKTRAAIALLVCAAPIAILAVIGLPRASDALVALRPKGLAPMDTQDAIYEIFGGRPGQWIVLSIDKDEERAEARADAIAEALDPLVVEGAVGGFDALATFAPAKSTQRARFAARDALDLPAKKAELARALEDTGFSIDDMRPALDAFAHPSDEMVELDLSGEGPLALLASRHIAHDNGDTLCASFVRPTGDAAKDARALAAIHAADPGALVTGWPHLEKALEQSLGRDLPRVGIVSLIVAAIALGATLRSVRDALLALAAVLVELGALALVMRAFGLRWHVYDALVVPVLIGITLDESLFLLHAAKNAKKNALETQGPLVVCTALTTSAGFAALLVCRFDGLRDLGMVGAMGSAFGLLTALVVVPAGLRLSGVSKPIERPADA